MLFRIIFNYHKQRGILKVNNCKIYNAGVNDIESIILLENDCDNDIYSPNLIKASIEDKFTYNFLYELNGNILGYVSAQLVFDECSLLKIVVGKNYRKQGIATELINYLKEYCLNNGINTINLEVREDNFSAISFKLQGVRKNYYDCKDALIYWCYIND